jgi:type VI secretion system protein ImpK
MIADVELQQSPLLEQFRAFYDEVVRIKGEVARGEAVPPESASERPVAVKGESAGATTADSPPTEAPPASEAPDHPAPKPPAPSRDPAQPVRTRLMGLLQAQVPESRRRGGAYGVGYYRDAQYAMAALADEIFLTLDWPGRGDWRNHLLEYELFGSYTAGETVFERVDQLLRERDPADGELAAVYLLALALGFRGKFRDADDGGRIESYRRQLFAFLFQSRPALDREDRRMFPEAYRHTLTRDAGERLPYLRRWLWLSAAIVLLFLVASALVWQLFTADLAEEVADLLRRFGGWTR